MQQVFLLKCDIEVCPMLASEHGIDSIYNRGIAIG